MAVLAQDIQLPVRGVVETQKQPLTGYTNHAGGNVEHTVYKGSILVSDVSDADGYFRAVPLSSSTNMATGDVFGGVAIEQVKVETTDTADGAKKVTAARTGVWGFAPGSLAITDLGADIYASDDQTVTTTSTNNLYIGTLVALEDSRAWVDIARAFGRVNVAVA